MCIKQKERACRGKSGHNNEENKHMISREQHVAVAEGMSFAGLDIVIVSKRNLGRQETPNLNPFGMDMIEP